MGAIKGVGESIIKIIIDARKQGLLRTFDFCSRIDRKVIVRNFALICSGSMDDLHHHGSKGRNEMLQPMNRFFYLRNRELAKDQGSLFGEIPLRKI